MSAGDRAHLVLEDRIRLAIAIADAVLEIDQMEDPTQATWPQELITEYEGVVDRWTDVRRSLT